MPSYKLTYFNGRGRAEVIRLLFAAAGQKYEDNRIEQAAWGDLKAKTPQGSLPVLEVDGKMMCQSQAVCRFLAREFKLYGKNNQEAAVIDQLMDTSLDLFTPFIPIAFNSNKEEQAEQFKTFAAEKAPKMLGFLEALMSGKNGFCVGQTVSVADFCIFTILESVIKTLEDATKTDILGKFPKISAMKKAVEAIPRIKDYLAKRPETAF